MSACSKCTWNRDVWANEKCAVCFLIAKYNQSFEVGKVLPVQQNVTPKPIKEFLYRAKIIHLARKVANKSQAEHQEFEKVVCHAISVGYLGGEIEDYVQHVAEVELDEKLTALQICEKAALHPLFAESAKCALTGITTKHIDMDHLYPISSPNYFHLRSSPHNLYFVDSGVNRMKGSMTPTEFEHYFRAILAHFSDGNIYALGAMNFVSCIGELVQSSGDQLHSALVASFPRYKNWECRCTRLEAFPDLIQDDTICRNCGVTAQLSPEYI